MVKKSLLFLFFYAFHAYGAPYQITYITAAMDLGRQDHGQAIIHGKYSFKRDYLPHVKRLLSLKWPLCLFIQKKYYPDIQEYIHDKVEVHFLEISDLEKTEFFKKIQGILKKNKKVYTGFHGSTYYRPLVLHKMHLIDSVIKRNPFNTEYFVWIDANKYTTNFNKKNHSILVDELSQGFIMHYLPMDVYHNIWGINKDAHDGYCGTECRHQIFACVLGAHKSVFNEVYKYYLGMLRLTLARGNLGTEENILVYDYYSHPELFNPQQCFYFYNLLSKRENN